MNDEEFVYFKLHYTGVDNTNGVTYEKLSDQVENHLEEKPIYIVSTPHRNNKLDYVDINDVMLVSKTFKDGKIGVGLNFNKFYFNLKEMEKEDNIRLSALYMLYPNTNEIRIVSFNLIYI